MINKFIKEILKLTDYNIKKINSWKDNLTYEIILRSWDSFIVQQMLQKKSDKNLKFIDEVISFITKKSSNITFAKKYLDKRFLNFNWNSFHIMKKINWKTISENNINLDIIKNTAKYIALFHNNIIDFNWKDYEEINYYKKIHNYRLEVKKSLKNELIKEVNDIFLKMDNIAKHLKENYDLPKWVIHWDPAFKNFLIDHNNNITWLIDYDMLSVNNFIWDLADLIRSYMKIEKFQKKEFEILINSYNSIRWLNKEEKNELKNYCTMMILDTWFRYLLSCFDSSNYNNLIWDKNDSLKKANRCLNEIEKLEWFNFL